MMSRRCDPDASRRDPVAIIGLLDSQLRLPSQDLGHQAPVVGVKMLDHDDRGRKVARE
jgi:hypothetical protein